MNNSTIKIIESVLDKVENSPTATFTEKLKSMEKAIFGLHLVLQDLIRQMRPAN